MIKRVVVASLLLSGCAVTESNVANANEEVPVYGAGNCDAGPTQELIGREASAELGAEALARSGARTIRWIQPGQAVTMDYRTDRLNIELDENNRVTAITCG